MMASPGRMAAGSPGLMTRVADARAVGAAHVLDRQHRDAAGASHVHPRVLARGHRILDPDVAARRPPHADDARRRQGLRREHLRAVTVHEQVEPLLVGSPAVVRLP